MKWHRHESEYRYYAAIEADVEPLPKSHKPNPHPLTPEARKKLRDLRRELKEVMDKEWKIQFRWRTPPSLKLKKKRLKIIRQMEEISQTGRRKIPEV